MFVGENHRDLLYNVEASRNEGKKRAQIVRKIRIKSEKRNQ